MTAVDPELLALATPAERSRILKALQAQRALASPADYAEAVTGGKYLRPAHVELLSQTLVELIEGRLLKPDGTPFRKLAVSMPPRHGKSELISKYTPAWFLTRYPTRRIAVCGYEADFAAEWGKKAREVLLDAPPGLAPALRDDSKAAARWYTKEGGGMFTAGVGGPLTGKGAHVLIIDDPVKNAEEAQSATKRETAWDWYVSTAYTRLEPWDVAGGLPGAVILVMTRWHEDDLEGRLLTHEGDDWYVLNLPALAGEDDPIGRAPGEALWPDRYPAAALGGIRDTLGPYWFSALYQQNPQIEGGGIFRAEKFRFFARRGGGAHEFVELESNEPGEAAKKVPMSQIATFGVVDLAASTKTTADWSVYALFGVTPEKDLLLLDRFRARIEGADHMATLERLHERWKPLFWGIEKATFGLTLLQTASRTGRIPVRELLPDKDKVSRAYAAGALVEAGKMYFPKTASWLSEFTQELLGFPNASNDDQVDVTAYAAKVLSDRLTPTRRPKRAEPTTLEERIEAHLGHKRRRNRRGAEGML